MRPLIPISSRPRSRGPARRDQHRARNAFLALAGCLGAVGPLVGQDPHTGHTMQMADAPPAASTSHIQVHDDPGRNELTVILGPIDLPAGSSHHMEQLPVQQGTIPFDLTIRGYRTEILDADGRPVPRIVLHHMNLLDPNRRELFLPIMLRVLAASHETPPVRVPGWLFGIPMRGGSDFLALAMLHNPTEVTYGGVTVRLIIEYKRWEKLPLYEMTPFHIDTMYPVTDTKAFDLPPGFSSKSWEGSPAVRGLIVGMGGHLHAFATRLTLEDVTTGQVLYDVRPELDEEGRIRDIPILTHRGKGLGAPVYPDHVYRVTAEYHNPRDVTIEDGGMGAIAGAVIPLESWPAANPGDQLFADDYEWVLQSQLEHTASEHQQSTGGDPGRTGSGGGTDGR